MVALFLSGCPNAYHNLAVASQAVAHSLKNVQDGIDLAVASGVMTQEERNDYNGNIADVALAGIELDKAIRSASASGASVQAQIDAFLLAFKKLQAKSLGIRDGNTRLAVSLGLTSAETSIAIIAAFQNGK
jgi:hypothetical protein